MDNKRPVTILSGFLGSGKTTLLNRLLRGEHGLRIAVMINDFGSVNIDKDLVVGQTGDVVELSGGCLCCTIRGDLLASAQELLRSGRAFDYVVVETSGVAEPSPVAQTFLVPELEKSFRLDAIVTVVDAANVDTWLAETPTAREQIRCADLMILNKLDLVSVAEGDRVHEKLAELNDEARVIPAVNADVPTELLLDIDAHRPGRSVKPADPVEGAYRWGPRHMRVESAAFEAELDLDYARFDEFLQALPADVFRAKGTVAIRGLARRVVFHRVGSRNVIDQGAPWDDQPRITKAVMIGRKVDSDALLEQLRACAATASPALA